MGQLLDSRGSTLLERKVFRSFGIGGHVLEGRSRSLRIGRGLCHGPGLQSRLRRGGGLGAGRSDLPDLEVVVPAAVVLAALEVEGHLDLVPDLVFAQVLDLILPPRP